jgi:uncharacterized protein YecT (DUF1311 family)
MLLPILIPLIEVTFSTPTNDVYKSLLSKLTGPEREALREEQRKWLAARDKSCAIYKGWVSCLSDYYERRIHELRTRA